MEVENHGFSTFQPKNEGLAVQLEVNQAEYSWKKHKMFSHRLTDSTWKCLKMYLLVLFFSYRLMHDWRKTTWQADAGFEPWPAVYQARVITNMVTRAVFPQLTHLMAFQSSIYR